MPNLKPFEIILILAVILLLFGAKRLPDAARGLGRSLRIFKSEVKAAQDDDGKSPPQEIRATSDEVTSDPVPPAAPATQPTTPTPSSAPQPGGTEAGSADR
jgi:sec-independent protein translocase protein TatA